MTDAGKEMLERADSSLSIYVRDWARIIYDATGDQTKVDRAIFLADLNGMFDPVKVAALASSSPVKPDCAEIERETIERLEKIAGMDLLALASGLEDNLCHRFCACHRNDPTKGCIQERAANVLRALSVTGEAREGEKRDDPPETPDGMEWRLKKGIEEICGYILETPPRLGDAQYICEALLSNYKSYKFVNVNKVIAAPSEAFVAGVREALEAARRIVSDRAAGGRILTTKEEASKAFDLIQAALSTLPAPEPQRGTEG